MASIRKRTTRDWGRRGGGRAGQVCLNYVSDRTDDITKDPVDI